MLKYGFSNLRRLREVKPVALRPITLLVGRNSSGKSTFLRTLPLFRQSISTRTSSPILWYGDLVDFGSFDVSVSSGQSNQPITFTFGIDELSVGSTRSFGFEPPRPATSRLISDVNIDINIVPLGQRTRISRISVSVKSISSNVIIDFDTSNRISALNINHRDAMDDFSGYAGALTTGALFPELRIMARTTASETDSRSVYWYSDYSMFHKAVFKLIRTHLDARIADKTLDDLVSLLFDNLTLTKKVFRNYERSVKSQIFKSFIKEISEDDQNNLYPQISNYITIASLPRLINSISAHLRATFGSILYIGPARARSERYYRYQDLAVSEIDPDGKNFPMFLNSLTRRQRTNLSEWIEKLFGYGVTISQESGHISIKLVEGDAESNIVDVGYGVSQILPVLGQIWWARARRSIYRGAKSNIIAIEQPELHLHPAHQALLADALVGETTQTSIDIDNDERISFLVETHSETLINRLGELIEQGKISAADVQILLFESHEEEEMVTTVRPVSFNSDGVLIDWPYGFFQPET